MSQSYLDAHRGWDVHPVFSDRSTDLQLLNRVLENIRNGPFPAGHSDVGVRNLLFTTVLNVRPRAILEIGGHVGAASVVIGSALKINGYGHHWVLEPDPRFFDQLSAYVKEAELSDFVTPCKVFSTDPVARSELQNNGPYQLVYLDAQHTFGAALEDLRWTMEILEDNGIIILHDTSEEATKYDEGGAGGVRKAIEVMLQEEPSLKGVFFEWPLWLNKTGTAMLVKQANS